MEGVAGNYFFEAKIVGSPVVKKVFDTACIFGRFLGVFSPYGGHYDTKLDVMAVYGILPHRPNIACYPAPHTSTV